MFVARFCSNGIVPKNSVNLFQEECLMMVIHVMVTAAGLVCGSCSYESRGRECLRSSPVSSTRTLQGARKRGSEKEGQWPRRVSPFTSNAQPLSKRSMGLAFGPCAL